MADFSPAQRTIVNLLVKARLATPGTREEDAEGTVHVAHEAGLTHWARAEAALAAHGADLELRYHLEAEANRWLAADRDSASRCATVACWPRSTSWSVMRTSP